MDAAHSDVACFEVMTSRRHIAVPTQTWYACSVYAPSLDLTQNIKQQIIDDAEEKLFYHNPPPSLKKSRLINFSPELHAPDFELRRAASTSGTFATSSGLQQLSGV